MSTATQINWKWADYQRDVRDQLEAGDVDLVVLRTGYGGGKSITGGQWIHRGALTDRSGDGESLVLAQDYAKGKSTTYSVFFKTLPGEDTNPFGDGDPENSPIVRTWHGNDKRLTYITGHTTFLGGADKWSRFAGAEFCRIWCDEVAHYPPTTDLYRLHEMLVTRQRTETGPNTTLWTSTGNGYNQFYDITERQVNRDEQPLRWADRMVVVTASTEDNPFLPPDGLEKIKAQFAGTEREAQGLHGGFAAAEGLVYPRFSREHHIRPLESLKERIGDWRMYCYDAGWDDPRVLLEIAKTEYDQYAVVDCLYQSECHVGDPDDVRPDTALGWLDGRDDGVMYCEHTPADIDKFRRAGWDARKADKDIDGGIDAVRERLELDGDGRPGLLVADHCTPLIQEFLSYQEEHVGKSNADDHACFVAGTQVLTETGERPIETITPGDRVLTREGYQPVLAAEKTAEDAEVVTAKFSNGRELTATANHPVHTMRGFKPLLSLRYGDLLTPSRRIEERCQKLKRSNTTGSHSAGIQTPRIEPTGTTTAPAETTSRMVLKPSTEKFGDTTTAKSQTGTSSTTKMATPPTTTLRTWSVSHRKSTPNAIQTGVAELRGKRSMPLRNGIVQIKDGSGIGKTPKKCGKTPKPKSKSANSVGMSLNTTQKPGSVQTPVKQSGGASPASTMSSPLANGAKSSLHTTNIKTDSSVRVNAVRDTGTTADVYNLSVFGRPEYFANGVLVHNCDALRYGIYTNNVRGDANEVSRTGNMTDLF